MIDIKVVRSFVFNRAILSIVLGACFLVMGLSMYVDHSQATLVTAAALEIATNNGAVLSQLASQGASPEILNWFHNNLREDVYVEAEILSPNGPRNDFQKNAVEALSENPDEPFFEIEQEPHLVLKYALNTSWGILQLTIPFRNLEKIANRESFITLCVLFILQGIGAISLSVFFGYLRLSTERMLESQREALEAQKNLTRSYERFFPRQFLYLLKKESVLDIHIGDQMEKEMAVLFSDIRGFTTLIEKKTPAESFKLINDYLQKAAPIIRNHNGFIDKYVGDAILALFDKPDDALTSILSIMKFLKEGIKETQDPSKTIREIGSGLHFGSLIVGTLGEEERMDGTVISDIVNTSSRLEELNKIYQTHVLISQQFIDQLTNKQKFKIRFIDHIYAAGKKESLKIFEVFDMDPLEIIEKKEKIQADFDQGIESYQNKKFPEALLSFQKCHEIYPEDTVTNIFIKRVEKLINEPPDETWTPIFKISHKDAF